MEIVIYLALIALYIYLIYLFFVYVFPIALAIGVILLSLVMMWRYFFATGSNLLWGEGWVETPDEAPKGEPAYQDYFFRKAFQDYWLIIQQSFEAIKNDTLMVVAWGVLCMNPFLWPVGVTIFVVAGISAIPAVISVLILGLVHLAVVAAFVLGALTLGGLLVLIERLTMAIQGRFLTCPDCHKKFSQPLYICANSACGAQHVALLPGRYGSLKRRCKCGSELPTLFLLGRNKIPAFCPHCTNPLSEETGVVANRHFPIVGGPSTGKSCFMTAGLVGFKDGAGDVSLTFPPPSGEKESTDQKNFQRAEQQYRSGEVMDKTSESQVTAFLAKLKDKEGTERLVHAYDVAGEVYRTGHELGSLPYLGYSHGLFFLIDPHSMAGVSSASSASTAASTSKDTPQDIFDTFVRAMIEHSKRSQIARCRVAVIITKSDEAGIKDSINGTTPDLMGRDPANLSDEERRSLQIRSWMNDNGEGNFVRAMEQSFKHVRYFECSALGRTPDRSGAPFVSSGVLPVWQWMLGNYGLKLSGEKVK